MPFLGRYPGDKVDTGMNTDRDRHSNAIGGRCRECVVVKLLDTRKKIRSKKVLKVKKDLYEK